MRLLERTNALLNRGLAVLAGGALVAMMLVTVAEMVLRLFGRPMAGTVEAIGWLAAATSALALGYTQLHRGHVAIDVVFRRFAPRLRRATESLTLLVGAALFALVSRQVLRHAEVLRATGSLSETMKVIVYPWVYVVAAGCAGLTLALFTDFVKSLPGLFAGAGARRGEPGASRPGD